MILDAGVRAAATGPPMGKHLTPAAQVGIVNPCQPKA